MNKVSSDHNEIENVIFEFVKLSRHLRIIVRRENNLILSRGNECQDFELTKKKVLMLKAFSDQSPFILEIIQNGEGVSNQTREMLRLVLTDVQHHLNINTNYQLASMKECLGKIEKIDNIRNYISDQIEFDEDMISCH